LPQKATRALCSPNATQLANSGKVTFQVNSSSGGFVTYAGGAGGYFTTTSGIQGQFRRVEIGFGLGLGIGLGVVGTSQNLLTFTGSNYNLSGSVGIVGGSLNFSTDDGSFVGGSGGLGTGSGTKPGVSGAVTYPDTQIYNVTCPRSGG
jgi:hypothetical protein